MKLLDKIKDLFMDEVAEDEEIELEETEKEEYKEPPKDVLPKVMRDTIKKEEEKVELKRKNDENINKTELEAVSKFYNIYFRFFKRTRKEIFFSNRF